VKPSIRDRLVELKERYEEVSHLLADPGVIGDNDRFRDYSREYSRLEPVVRDFSAFEAAEKELASASEICGSDDPDMRAMGEEAPWAGWKFWERWRTRLYSPSSTRRTRWGFRPGRSGARARSKAS
jgi:protein subunit release factor A